MFEGSIASNICHRDFANAEVYTIHASQEFGFTPEVLFPQSTDVDRYGNGSGRRSQRGNFRCLSGEALLARCVAALRQHRIAKTRKTAPTDGPWDFDDAFADEPMLPKPRGELT